MNTNYLEKLEYNTIKNILSTFACTYIGKDLCLNLYPSSNKESVKYLLDETEEGINLIYKNNTPPISEIADNTINLKTLESYGTLSIKSILDLTEIFKISVNLKKYFQKDYIIQKDFPILSDLFNKLYTNISIIKIINDSIIDENTLSDNASKNLNLIRKKQKNIIQDIKTKLNNFIHSSSYSKYIQENVVTIRNNRYVIPVKEEYKSQIKGFVHDISSSGSTVFIEPISVFELNNELNNLKIEENIEIEKILQDLTKQFYPYIEELKLDIEIIGKLDFVFAKSKYAKSINGIIPNINDSKKIVLEDAKHPLLNLDTAIPITIILGDSFNTLVITGPNTGGKTVTLKTLGLLSAMSSSGLAIPAKDNSSIYVFDNIFADIGDEQSIENSLSTFSSHMKNIIEIIDNSTENSLVLVDELGSGTDPLEGACLAISILEYFKNKDCLTVATTHYQELKKYALITPKFENASVEFDINTLSPTYKLLIGIPGKSNAFEISKKLGLHESIISNAKNNISKKDIEFEELLKNIYDEKIKLDEQENKLSEELIEIAKLKSALQKDNSELINKQEKLINDAKVEARNILLEAKEKANLIISKMSNNSNNTQLNNLRNLLNDEIKNINISKESSESNNPISIDEIKPNCKVFVTTFNQDGIVLSNINKSNEVQIQIGNIKTNINIKYLEKPKTPTKSPLITTHAKLSKLKHVSTEINVIGLNVDEAIPIVDKFIDDASLLKLQSIRIVHGKGTGKLRKGIHEFLKSNLHVSNFRIGTFGEGEMGVTIVELK